MSGTSVLKLNVLGWKEVYSLHSTNSPFSPEPVASEAAKKGYIEVTDRWGRDRKFIPWRSVVDFNVVEV